MSGECLKKSGGPVGKESRIQTGFAQSRTGTVQNFLLKFTQAPMAQGSRSIVRRQERTDSAPASFVSQHSTVIGGEKHFRENIKWWQFKQVTARSPGFPDGLKPGAGGKAFTSLKTEVNTSERCRINPFALAPFLKVLVTGAVPPDIHDQAACRIEKPLGAKVAGNFVALLRGNLVQVGAKRPTLDEGGQPPAGGTPKWKLPVVAGETVRGKGPFKRLRSGSEASEYGGHGIIGSGIDGPAGGTGRIGRQERETEGLAGDVDIGANPVEQLPRQPAIA